MPSTHDIHKTYLAILNDPDNKKMIQMTIKDSIIELLFKGVRTVRMQRILTILFLSLFLLFLFLLLLFCYYYYNDYYDETSSFPTFPPSPCLIDAFSIKEFTFHKLEDVVNVMSFDTALILVLKQASLDLESSGFKAFVYICKDVFEVPVKTRMIFKMKHLDFFSSFFLYFLFVVVEIMMNVIVPRQMS
jgi:hypothetical protein